MPTNLVLTVPTNFAEAREAFDQLLTLLDRVPSLDQLIHTYRDTIIVTLVVLAAVGVAFVTLVSFIAPQDFHGETADGPDGAAPLVAAEHADDGKAHLLLLATGSVAAIKLPHLITALTAAHPPATLSIRVVVSAAAARFLTEESATHPFAARLDEIPGVDGVYTDAAEWTPAWTRGAPILHVELRRWAHVGAVVPLSADALAKFAGGLADDLASSVVRAWDTTGKIDGRKKTLLVAPAMNTAMWEHPVTAKHVRVLEEEWGVEKGGWVEVLRPVEKTLACGDTGSGAMMEWTDIVTVLEKRLGLEALSSK